MLDHLRRRIGFPPISLYCNESLREHRVFDDPDRAETCDAGRQTATGDAGYAGRLRRGVVLGRSDCTLDCRWGGLGCVSKFDQLILRVKRGNTPLTRFLRGLGRIIYQPSGGRLPAWLKSPFRLLYEFHYLTIVIFRNLSTRFYRHPPVSGPVCIDGPQCHPGRITIRSGHADIHVGNDVYLGGMISIMSGRFTDQPKLFIGDRASINWHTTIMVNQLVVIEDDVKIASNCRISDSAGIHAKLIFGSER